MDKLCKVFWEQTPALSVSYKMQTAVQKSAKDRTPLAGTMLKEGTVTIPLLVIGAALILTAVPCICVCCYKGKCKHEKKECSHD